MKKEIRRALGAFTAGVLLLAAPLQALAQTFSAGELTEGEADSMILFPGDSVSGLDHPAYLGFDYSAPVELGENASWTNLPVEGLANRAYEVSLVQDEADPEASHYDIIPVGYMLTVTDGVSSLRYADGADGHHDPNASSDGTGLRTDKAWYPSGEYVSLEALPAPDGVQVFQYFEAEGANVTVQQDESDGSYYIIMPDQEVRLRAVYCDPIPETDPIPEQQEDDGQTAEDDAAYDGADAYADVTSDMDGMADSYAEAYDAGEGENQYDAAASGAEPIYVEGAPVEVQDGVQGAGNDPAVGPVGEELQTLQDAQEQPVQVTVEDAGPVQMLTPEGEPAGEFQTTDSYDNAEQTGQSGSIFDAVSTDAFEITNSEEFSDQAAASAQEDVQSGEEAAQQPEEEANEQAQEDGQVRAEAEEDPEAEEVTESVTEIDTEAEPESGSAQPETGSEKTSQEASVEVQTETSAVPLETETPAQTEVQTEQPQENADEPETPETSAQPETSETPETPATPATYKITFADPGDVTITDASGNAISAAEGVTAEAGAVFTITADTSNTSRKFTGWSLSSTASALADAGSASTKLTLGEGDVTVTASYTAVNEVKVTSGSGAGLYAQGDTVSIKADKADSGWRFDHWEVTGGNVSLADATASKTTFTMPGSAVKLRAVYTMITYELDVIGGKGSGSYAMEEGVSLEADWPAAGKEFDKWSIISGHPDITGTDRFYATLTMPASDVTVKATYKDGPNPAYNAIQNLESGAEYLKGTTLTFHAAGNGMDNSNPNPGDYRYKPTGYQIGNVSGGWQDGSYTTSMAINAVGDYTLTVTFTREVYRDGAWTSDGTTDTKSVSFHVVNALSVQTGDNTPILAFSIAAVAALAVIILLISRRRREGNMG